MFLYMSTKSKIKITNDRISKSTDYLFYFDSLTHSIKRYPLNHPISKVIHSQNKFKI